ncbi:IS3 family transposase, partial [Vagococcus fluvialis]
MSRSGYYHYLQTCLEASIKNQQDYSDYTLILEAYRFKNRNKGARLIKMTLEKHFNTVMNLKKIRRLMK